MVRDIDDKDWHLHPTVRAHRPKEGAYEVRQLVAGECTALVWKDDANPFKKANRPGHVGILLRRPLATTYRKALWNNAQQVRYISFWPGRFQRLPHVDFKDEMGDRTRQRLAAGTVAPRPRQVGVGYTETTAKDFQFERSPLYGLSGDIESYDEFRTADFTEIDAVVWGNVQEESYHLPGLSKLRPYEFGLDLQRMLNYAIDKYGSDENVKWVRLSKTHNCAGVAMGVLIAGGGSAFAEAFLGDEGTIYAPSAQLLTVTPRDCLGFLEHIAQGIFAANNAMGDINRFIALHQGGPSPTSKARVDRLYKKDEFQKETRSWKIRGFILRRIGKYLGKYEAYSETWNAEIDNIKDVTLYKKRLFILLKLVKATAEHIRVSKSERRLAGFVMLATQIRNEVAKLTSHRHAGDMFYGEELGLDNTHFLTDDADPPPPQAGRGGLGKPRSAAR